jgi:HK97 family phage major capsid protein
VKARRAAAARSTSACASAAGAGRPTATNVGADGGFLVPTEFATDIAKLSLDADNFLTRTDQVPVSGNSITFPSDETTPWGSNGVRAYWAAEAAAATADRSRSSSRT